MKQPKSLICHDPHLIGETMQSLRAWRTTLLRWRRNDPDDLSVDWALETVDDAIKYMKESES